MPGARLAAPSPALVAELVTANRILFAQNIVDAFGHISVRHDKEPGTYLLSRNRAPGLVNADDIVTLDLDSVALTHAGVPLYLERFIHGEIYRSRPEVMSVIHCHAPPLIPFGVTAAPLRAIFHMSGFLGTGVPVFDIRDAGGMTDMLISNPALGAAMARVLAGKPMVLMRGHGATVVGSSIRQAVFRAVNGTMNAMMQAQAHALGDIRFLSEEEAVLAAETGDKCVDRAWDLWAATIG